MDPKLENSYASPPAALKVYIIQSQKDIWEDYELKKTCLRVN